MADHTTMFLGKRPRRHDQRTLMMANYLTAALPPAPASVDYTQGLTDWGIMRNDQLGCCTIAAVGHAVQAWTVNAGSRVNFADRTIDLYYEKWDGYNPANPATDQGGVELDVLNDWRQQGFAGHALDAYAAVGLGAGDWGLGAGGSGLGTRDSGFGKRVSESQTSKPEFRILEKDDAQFVSPSPESLTSSPVSRIPDIATAIWLFGGAYIGVELPITAQNQDVWDVPANLTPNDEPGSWGGHAIYLVGYDFQNSGLGTRGSGPGTTNSASRISNSGSQSPAPSTQPPTLTCITWGQTKKMTWAWFQKYCSEAYALVSKDWLKASGVAPSGFDLATLESDLKAVTT